jgi:hypothetical protein
MAAIAREDQQKRTVQVDRQALLSTLIANKAKHVAEYNEAVEGYRLLAVGKIEEAYESALKQLGEKYKKLVHKTANLKDSDIPKQRDTMVLVEPISVEVKVPRSYEEEYAAAIDMVSWDVRQTLELTHAEFTCFVRDQWDWKSGFEAVSMLYKKVM